MENQEIPKEKEKSIMQKIAALVAKANSTDSAEERDSFMLAAQRLLLKYNLDMSQVTQTTSEDGKVREDYIKFNYMWEGTLMSTICRNNFCKVIYHGGNNPAKGQTGEMSVIGKPNNIAVCEYLYSFFKNKILQMSVSSYDGAIKLRKEMLAAFGKKMPKGHREQYVVDYLDGAVEGIGQKMSEQKRESVRNDAQVAGLVLANDNAVAKYVAEKYPRLGYCRGGGGRARGEGYGNGVVDGRRISVNSGVTGSGISGRIG